MRFLLDTQVFLWMQVAPERLRHQVRHTIEDANNSVLLSAASSWEISIKYGLGKLALPQPPSEYVPDRMETSGVSALPVQHSHALRVASLPMHHRDPFDRLLVAQSHVEGLALITADPIFGRYDVEVLEARAPHPATAGYAPQPSPRSELDDPTDSAIPPPPGGVAG